jgi:hypothetical protein
VYLSTLTLADRERLLGIQEELFNAKALYVRLSLELNYVNSSIIRYRETVLFKSTTRFD